MEREEVRARQVAVEAEPLGHVARAGADPEVVDRAPVDRGGVPESGRRKPSRHESSVVLPAPLGPIRPSGFAAAHLEGHAVERAGAPAEAAVGLGDVLDGDHGRDDTASSVGFREYGLFFRDF